MHDLEDLDTENLENVTTQNLRALVAETESTLAELKEELERREAASQHREIANLDSHMKSAELSLKTIRDFIAYLLDGVKADKK